MAVLLGLFMRAVRGSGGDDLDLEEFLRSLSANVSNEAPVAATP